MGSLRDELRRRLGGPLIRATRVPRRRYGDPEHHRVELDAVYRHGWSCVGMADQVAAPGSFTTALVGGEIPVVITRDAKGELHGFLNVCRHLAAPVAEGSGQVRVLQCPYHWWIYELDGRLSKARGMADVPGFDVADSGLFPVQVATWSRFLFANPDLEALPLDLGDRGCDRAVRRRGDGSWWHRARRAIDRHRWPDRARAAVAARAR